MQSDERITSERDTHEPDQFLFGAVFTTAIVGMIVGATIGIVAGLIFHAIADAGISVWFKMMAGALGGLIVGGVFAATQVAGPFDHK